MGSCRPGGRPVRYRAGDMARPSSPSERRRQADERRAGAQHSATRRAERRKRIIAFVVIAGLVLSSGGAVIGVIIGSLASSSPTTTSVPTRPTFDGGSPAELTFPPAGATAPAGAPCPDATAAPERTTVFGGPPPQCLTTLPDGSVDTTIDYVATMSTTAGDLVWLLNTEIAPQAVNAFVYLARYGYFDGAPFDTITPLAWAELGGSFTGDTGGSPGFDLRSEAPSSGMVATPGMLAMATDDAGVADPGRLVLALGDRAAGLPLPTTFFGLLLDGAPTLAAIQRSGSPSGIPTGAVVVERVTVTAEPAS